MEFFIGRDRMKDIEYQKRLEVLARYIAELQKQRFVAGFNVVKGVEYGKPIS